MKISICRCPSCFEEYSDGTMICPGCGYDVTAKPKEIYHMPPGTILKEKYYVGKVIGYGGFGVVYKAWDIVLEQVVALKEFYPTMYVYRDANTNSVHVYDEKKEAIFLREKEAFLNEARNIAKYNKHPSIVHIFDYFSDNGTAYFVMEYLDGFSLRECNMISQQAGLVVDINSAVKITVAILDALAIVHKDGIIHRDIKPANIYVLKDGSIKLFDFGAARFIDEDGNRDKTIIFTPGYAPPEQYEKKSKQGAFTDIYAIGAILYELVTGVRLDESINRKVHDDVKPPEIYNKAVPDYLSNAIMRAIAVSPEIRFKTADEFRDILLFSQVTRSAKQEIKRRNRKRNLRIAAIALLILVVSAFAGKIYVDKDIMANLYETTVSVWVSDAIAGDGQNVEALIREALTEFVEAYPNVSVDIQIFDSSVYEERLLEAFEQGSGPDVFESTYLSDESNIYMANMSSLISECQINVTDYYGLGKYEDKGAEVSRFPVLFNADAVYKNSMVSLSELSSDYYDFKEGIVNYEGTVLDYDTVAQDMPGKFEVIEPKKDDIIHFTQSWSINTHAKRYQQIVARRLVGYFLSDKAQQVFSIDENVGLPLSRETLYSYLEMYSDFSYVTNYLNN